MNIFKKIINSFFSFFGYKIEKRNAPDMGKDFFEIQEKVKDFTMTSIERQYALFEAVKYITDKEIDGDIVECGVWRGGSSMLATLTLLKSNSKHRDIYLYDTYTGMSEPTDFDVNIHGNSSKDKWHLLQKEKINEWDYASLEEVKKNVLSTEYPKEKIIFIKGKVEETIPKNLPKKISILRLDTDWYESTKHELENLFPLLSPDGVLIIDDYGHWQGARKAVDEYFGKNKIKILLNRIDYTGRIGIKI